MGDMPDRIWPFRYLDPDMELSPCRTWSEKPVKNCHSYLRSNPTREHAEEMVDGLKFLVEVIQNGDSKATFDMMLHMNQLLGTIKAEEHGEEE